MNEIVINRAFNRISKQSEIKNKTKKTKLRSKWDLFIAPKQLRKIVYLRY